MYDIADDLKRGHHIHNHQPSPSFWTVHTIFRLGGQKNFSKSLIIIGPERSAPTHYIIQSNKVEVNVVRTLFEFWEDFFFLDSVPR